MNVQDATILAAIVGAGAAIVAMLFRELIQWLRETQTRGSESKQRRAERLRELYLDVLTAAIRVTPIALQYRPTGGPGWLPPDEADRMRARLSLERLEDGDEILKAFIGVANWSSMYEGYVQSRAIDPDRVPIAELRKTEELIRENMAKIEELGRARLRALG